MANEQHLAFLERRVSSLEMIITEMRRELNVQTVQLNTRYNDLKGNFNSSSRNVCVECDGTGGAFTVYLPDAKSTEQIIFRLRKSDTTASVITIKGITGQTINGADEQTLTTANENMPIYAINGNWVKA